MTHSAIKMLLFIVILGHAVCSVCGVDTTDDSQVVRQQDLLAAGGSIFKDESSSSYAQLLFDVARNQLVVGARDYLFRLSLRDLKELERASWLAPNETVEVCQNKGQSEINCHNYVKILLSNGSRVFTCGTNAFSPICSWREIENVRTVLEFIPGIAKCPYNPHSNITALLTMSGEHYVGSSIDFTSSDNAIYRTPGTHTTGNQIILRTNQHNPYWLTDPQFVGSFDDDKFVYFVFRESAVEYMNCEKKILSRVARVCKNDVGGRSMLLKDNWTTFVKARLNCSLPGEYPFYYDEVQGMTYIPEEKMMYATFTTSSNGIAASAVCAYSLDALDAAFRGPFKHRANSESAWERKVVSDHTHFECGTQARSQQFVDSYKYQLMDDAIQPVSSIPIYTSDLERFSHIAVDVTPTKYSTQTHVLFVATNNGRVKKLSVKPDFVGSCLVEVWKFEDEVSSPSFQTMQYLEETNSLYIGTSQLILRVPVQRCAQHSTRESCLRLADPYCGWDERTDVCSTAPSGDDSTLHWEQAGPTCPSFDTPVDGGWSTWSGWEYCFQDDASEEPRDKCLCKMRQCNNPTPLNGGMKCKGLSVTVTNCTVHGGWTDWSSWSACSATCDIAVKSRHRWCSSPPPAHGGRLCVGADSQEVFCTSIPPCPKPVSQATPLDGGWSAWGPWGECLPVAPARAACGGTGFKERQRKCTQPSPARGGAPCGGAEIEKQPCELRPCDTRKEAAWTPWIQENGNSSDGSYVEKRYKFVCKAQTVEPVKLAIAKQEERLCKLDGVCSTVFASPILQSAGEWSAWGEWEPCHDGLQISRRNCISVRCDGNSIIQRTCQVEPCLETEGWSAWSEWSICIDSSGEQSRRKQCENKLAGCSGTIVQTRNCDQQNVENNLSSWRVEADSINLASSSLEVWAGVGGFLIGCLCCIAVFYALYVFIVKKDPILSNRFRLNKRMKVPSSPHYITSQENCYVSVPLKEVPKKKRQPSFNGICSTSSGIILSKNNLNSVNNHNNSNLTPKLLPKAIANEYDTLKRNSHSSHPTMKNNNGVDQDKYY